MGPICSCKGLTYYARPVALAIIRSVSEIEGLRRRRHRDNRAAESSNKMASVIYLYSLLSFIPPGRLLWMFFSLGFASLSLPSPLHSFEKELGFFSGSFRGLGLPYRRNNTRRRARHVGIANRYVRRGWQRRPGGGGPSAPINQTSTS